MVKTNIFIQVYYETKTEINGFIYLYAKCSALIGVFVTVEQLFITTAG